MANLPKYYWIHKSMTATSCFQMFLFLIAFTLLGYTVWNIKYASETVVKIKNTWWDTQRSQLKASPAATDACVLDQLLTPDFPVNINSLQQDDPILHKYCLVRHLTPPSKLPYSFPKGVSFENDHTKVISEIFKNKRDGTFIEAGAYDGLSGSNTLLFEKEFGWRGLLVECNPMIVPYLYMKRRNAWVANVCLSSTTTPTTVNFSNPTKWQQSARVGEPIDMGQWKIKTDWANFEMQALPIFALLAAINMTEIDYISLDVESKELEVLKTIPFDKVTIKVIDMEVHFYSSEQRDQINDFLKSKAFRLWKNLTQRGIETDRFYVHSSVYV